MLQVAFHIKSVLFIKVRKLLVPLMLGNVEFIAQEWPDTAQLQDTFVAIHDRKFVPAHKLFATMSSDEFKNGQKNNPPRLKGGKCYFKCSYLTIIFSLGLQIGFIHNTTVSGSTSYSQASILASTIIPISQA